MKVDNLNPHKFLRQFVKQPWLIVAAVLLAVGSFLIVHGFVLGSNNTIVFLIEELVGIFIIVITLILIKIKEQDQRIEECREGRLACEVKLARLEGRFDEFEKNGYHKRR